MSWSDATVSDAMSDASPVIKACVNASIANATSFFGHRTPWIKQLQILTYTLTPQDLYFATLEETPSFITQPVPLVMVCMILEAIILLFMGRKDDVRVNNYVTNFTSTALQDSFTNFIFRGAELFAYIWVYDNFRLFTMPWDSFYTYVFAMLAVDYFAYWWHRGSHEIALFWAAHEFHHNSEDFNLGVAMRLSYAMRLYKWLFYLPTAIMGLPVSTMWAHAQVGLVFNGFSHFTMVPPLGTVIPVLGDIIEFIFVTPTHHRIHHAMNEYAIDKNYGNVFIIWDRMHGTFVGEKEGEEISYGSLTPLETTSGIQLQNAPFQHLWEKIQSMDTFGDKVRAVFYGPGWFPDRPRLGLREELPDMRGRPKWEMKMPRWFQLYLLVNSLAVFALYIDEANRVKELSDHFKLFCFLNIYCSFWTLGALYDYEKRGIWMELVRLLVFFGCQSFFSIPLIVAPKTYKLSLIIASLDVILFPFVAKHVLNRIASGPSDQELYMKTLERLKYIQPKSK